ncbi:MAG: exo-alpha-sialidase [Planctomycetales bacterium]|nr:exo-alpha-sialidase [Planctomycetales bacterium]
MRVLGFLGICIVWGTSTLVGGAAWAGEDAPDQNAGPSGWRVTALQAEQPLLPALIGNPAAAITRVRIDVEGDAVESLEARAFAVRLGAETKQASLASAEVFYTGASAGLDVRQLVGASRFGSLQPAKRMIFEGRQKLTKGANYFWMSYTLRPEADLESYVDAVVESVEFSDGTSRKIAATESRKGQRIGVALRKAGDDEVSTYRIPGLTTTNSGALIAVYDVRRRSGRDLPGDIDIGMSRSVDGGQSWEAMKIVLDMGADPQHGYDGVGDPAVLFDPQTNTIWVAGLWSHGNRGWSGSGAGLEPDETGQLMMVCSKDDGVTWSEPRNVTPQVKRPEWCLLLQGPGKGIAMRDGTLVFAAQFQDVPQAQRLPRSTVLYSTDHGDSWQIGAGAFDDTTEAQVIELEPGRLMLNARYNRAPRRVVMITDDLGKTWREHPTSRNALVEPGACMASLIHVDHDAGDPQGRRLLFSNPQSEQRRENMTLQLSLDGGETWPEDSRLLLDAGRSAGYSCLTMIDRETVGILYEGSQSHLTFQRIRLQELQN